MKVINKLLAIVGLVCVGAVAHAQNEPPMYNENSVDPIPAYEQLYK